MTEFTQRNIEFSGGHAQKLREKGYLLEDELFIDPHDLIEQAVEKADFETAIDILHQEITNAYSNIGIFDMLVTHIDGMTEHLNEETVVAAVELLEEYNAILRKDPKNARLIIKCIDKIETVKGGDWRKSDLPDEQKQLIFTIHLTFQYIKKALDERGDEYTRMYALAKERIEKFIDNLPDEDEQS